MKNFILAIYLLFALNSFGQSNVLIGQYFQLMPVFAPSLTGANDFLDVRMGTRHQWMDHEGAPRTYFLCATGVVNFGKTNPHNYNSVRVSDISPYLRRGVKVGVGGYVFDDKLGVLTQVETMMSSAVHISITQRTHLSLGISMGGYGKRIDMSGVYVLHPQNDDVYQDYINNGTRSNYLKLNSGISVYSDGFYLSYSSINMVNSLVSGNENIYKYSSKILHTLIGGYRIALNPHFEAIPTAYIRYSEVLPLLFDLGARVRYQQNLYIGMSYRNDQSFIAMFGVTLSDLYNFGYSFEHKGVDYGLQDPNSHEIIIGIQLFNHKKHTPIW